MACSTKAATTPTRLRQTMMRLAFVQVQQTNAVVYRGAKFGVIDVTLRDSTTACATVIEV